MNRSMLMGGLLGVAVASAGGAFATYAWVDRTPAVAEVLSVEPVKETSSTPRQVCREVTVTRQKPVQDAHRIAGTAVGAVVGGLLGNQVGGGNGKKIATVVGAVGGGYAGNQVQGRMQAGDTYASTETRCETVKEQHEKVVGYDVKYRIDGKPGTVRMDHEPGDTIPLRDGQLVLSSQ